MIFKHSINFKNPFDNEIVITGIVRDVAKTLREDYIRLNRAFKNFKSVKWFLVESDSKDDSLQVLRTISSIDFNFSWQTLGILENDMISRAKRLAVARNYYVDKLQKQEFSSANAIVVADFNGLSNLISEKAILSCWEKTNWGAATANQLGPYYDIWALRHPLWSPNDCWKVYEFFRKYSKFPEYALFSSVNSKMIKIPPGSDWIEVQSAFGGFAIYDANFFRQSKYSSQDLNGIETCEHVSFNQRLIELGAKIFINPNLINTRYTDHSSNTRFYKSLGRIIRYSTKLVMKIKF